MREFLTVEQVASRATDREILGRFRRLEETAMALVERLAERDGIPADELLRKIRRGTVQ